MIRLTFRFPLERLTKVKASSGPIGTKMPDSFSFNSHSNWMAVSLPWLHRLLHPEFLDLQPIYLLHQEWWAWLHLLHLDKCTILWVESSFWYWPIFFSILSHVPSGIQSLTKTEHSSYFRRVDGGCIRAILRKTLVPRNYWAGYIFLFFKALENYAYSPEKKNNITNKSWLPNNLFLRARGHRYEVIWADHLQGDKNSVSFVGRRVTGFSGGGL